jgi:hypothetical protein
VNRKLKKYNLKYEYLKLEKQDVEESFWEFVEDFENHFDKYYQKPKKGTPTAKERHVWVNEETGEVRYEAPETSFEDMFEENKRAAEEKEKARVDKIEEMKSRPGKLKRLYKKIAVKTHPDRGGSEGEFQDVNDAFTKLDLATLLNYAGKYEVNYEVEDDDIQILEKNLNELESEIKQRKKTLAWKWGTGDKKARLEVVQTIKHQTGWEVDEEDLPEDLKPKKDEQILLEDKKSLDNKK